MNRITTSELNEAICMATAVDNPIHDGTKAGRRLTIERLVASGHDVDSISRRTFNGDNYVTEEDRPTPTMDKLPGEDDPGIRRFEIELRKSRAWRANVAAIIREIREVAG